VFRVARQRRECVQLCRNARDRTAANIADPNVSPRQRIVGFEVFNIGTRLAAVLAVFRPFRRTVAMLTMLFVLNAAVVATAVAGALGMTGLVERI
jgi:hypothetical protein